MNVRKKPEAVLGIDCLTTLLTNVEYLLKVLQN